MRDWCGTFHGWPKNKRLASQQLWSLFLRGKGGGGGGGEGMGTKQSCGNYVVCCHCACLSLALQTLEMKMDCLVLVECVCVFVRHKHILHCTPGFFKMLTIRFAKCKLEIVFCFVPFISSITLLPAYAYLLYCLSVACLTSQQQSVSQRWSFSHSLTCFHTEIEVCFHNEIEVASQTSLSHPAIIKEHGGSPITLDV